MGVKTRMKKYREELLEEAMLKGRQEGRQEGKQEGEQKGKLDNTIETAKKMLTLHFSNADIVAVTGLSEQEIEDLKIEE